MTGFAAAKGSFTTTMDHDRQSIEGLGFRPLAVVAWWARQASAGTKWGNRGGIGSGLGRQLRRLPGLPPTARPRPELPSTRDDVALFGLESQSQESQCEPLSNRSTRTA